MIRLSLASALLASVALSACDTPEPAQSPPTTPPTQASAPAGASGPLSAQAIERAVWTPAEDPAAPAGAAASAQAPTAPGDEGAAAAATTPPRPEIIRAQILLERARFSPGAIDGLGGDNTSQAVAAFEEANGLPVDGKLDDQVFARLIQGAGTVMTTYAITAADIAGPFEPNIPTDLVAQSELNALSYRTPLEMLAERFHVTEGLLTALNPGVNFAQAGQTLVVPAVAEQPLPAAVTRIAIDKAEGSLRAFGEDGTLLAFYPATVGSTARPAPTGRLTVVGVAPEPNYTYDPSRVSYDRGDKRVVVPAGPNNPVGSVWIDLSRDTYGIHGTPEPSKIAKTASSGCVRLTNWSAEQLAKAVKPGVEVIFS
ncbi:hypothetical protein BZG35_07620 [Brevundimonas sp. LM2]|uniref:L,D-transpeptidase family protein n=1 Tax=Brevundimonas sp. LM2 TaxID=1938605 RepID=UPI0009839850|nr:L,D-transpeptidase [Brevundimonas sp. LM2]AQR61536.1 hypothetical protein BZG35_07620 [Brevundimonas sp. LM2]